MSSSLIRVANASVAQSVEQGTENPCVGGSIPPGSTISCGFSSSGRAPPCQGGGSEFDPRNPLHMYRGNIPGIERPEAKASGFIFLQIRGIPDAKVHRKCLYTFDCDGGIMKM